MSQIGTKLRKATGTTPPQVMLMHWCPGCDEPHGIRIEGPDGWAKWTFNGDYEIPHFEPSIRCFTTHTTDDDDTLLQTPVDETLCHYFIHNGRIEFCGDCPHKLAGQTVDIPDWPYASGSYGGLDE